MRRVALVGVLLGLVSACRAQTMVPHTLQVGAGKQITLSLPDALTVNVAFAGLHRPRFFAMSPDHRVFVTDMHSLADNTQGAIYILDGWNEQTHTFARMIPYLQHLRNPNNVAFYTDPNGQAWLYTALTDRLVRYRYAGGDVAPAGDGEVLARYPDYGLNYKYGGWHLTRTIAFGVLHGYTRLFVSVGSSCNACLEKEPVRASLQMMDPDGTHHGTVARGLRNAVGLSFIAGLDGGSLFATNMGADHLGDTEPEDQVFELDSNTPPGALALQVGFHFTNWLEGTDGRPGTRAGNEMAIMPVDYGWPTCFFAHGKAQADPLVSAPKATDRIFPPAPAGPAPPQVDCGKVPAAYTTFRAHSSPLGLEYFGDGDGVLGGSFLVALHGAGHPRIGTGYRVVRFSPGQRAAKDFITGFLTGSSGNPVVVGRPCGMLRTGKSSFLLTDDHLGVVYFVHPAR